MTQMTLRKGEVIFYDNAFSDSMFLVDSGIVNLCAPKYHIEYSCCMQNQSHSMINFDKFRSGSHFWEIDMVLNQRRNGTAITSTQCELYRIQKVHFDLAIKSYPDAKSQLIDDYIVKNR